MTLRPGLSEGSEQTAEDRPHDIPPRRTFTIASFAPGVLKHFGEDDRRDPTRWRGLGGWLGRWHFCPLDADCRRFGICWRLHYFGKKYSYMLALAPSGRFFAPGPVYPIDVWEKMQSAMRADPRLFFDDLGS